jgi:hypothetical protein
MTQTLVRRALVAKLVASITLGMKGDIVKTIL